MWDVGLNYLIKKFGQAILWPVNHLDYRSNRIVLFMHLSTLRVSYSFPGALPVDTILLVVVLSYDFR